MLDYWSSTVPGSLENKNLSKLAGSFRSIYNVLHGSYIPKIRLSLLREDICKMLFHLSPHFPVYDICKLLSMPWGTDVPFSISPACRGCGTVSGLRSRASGGHDGCVSALFEMQQLQEGGRPWRLHSSPCSPPSCLQGLFRELQSCLRQLSPPINKCKVLQGW